MRAISIPSGDVELAATLWEPAPATTPATASANGSGILYIHGWRSSKDSAAYYLPALVEMGFTCLAFDLPGMGESTGNLQTTTRAQFLDASMAAFDRLASEDSVQQVSVIGSSFGGYLAALLCGERRVESLVLRVPADLPDEIFGEAEGALARAIDERDGELPGQRDPLTEPQKAVSKFQGAVLVVESELDDPIPATTVARFRDSAAPHVKHVVMKGAPHSFETQEQHDEYVGLLREFFAG